MDEYRKIVKRRRIISLIYHIFTWALWFVVISLKINVFQTQWLSALFVVILMFGNIVNIGSFSRYNIALKNNDVLHELYIEEHDERNILIRARSGETTLTVLMRVLIVAAFVSALFSKTVFFTLAAVLIFTWILRLAVKSHFKKVL